MGRLPLSPARVALVALTAVLAALVGVGCGSAAGGTPSALADIASVGELREAFAADEGKARLLLILSPT
jgi:hypothetical protein